MSFKIPAAAAAFLALAATAHASCPTNVEVLKPGPGQVTGCPVYYAVSPTRCWWSDSVDAPPHDNNLYGIELPAGLAQCQQIQTIVTQNWMLTQLGNAFSSDMALAPVTFGLSGKSFVPPTLDGEVLEIAGRIRQGF